MKPLEKLRFEKIRSNLVEKASGHVLKSVLALAQTFAITRMLNK
ncbi:hypothetical protein [Planococcus versutus]